MHIRNMAISLDIKTNRLLITPFREEHITDRYLNWLNDPELMRYSEQRHKTHTFESCRAYLQSFKKTPHYFWAIEEVATGIGHIGNINAYVDTNNSLADVGILIGEKRAQSQKFGLEAWIGVCNFLFQERGVRKLTAGAMSVNFPMLKLMRRVKMVNDGERRQHFIYRGQAVDIVHMALFKEQWDKMIYSN